MGSWSTAIFSDDTACDVRDDFKDYIGDGYSSSEATNLIIAEWQKSLDDPDEESIFWLSLAVTQWNIGRLEKKVKNCCLKEDIFFVFVYAFSYKNLCGGIMDFKKPKFIFVVGG